MGNMVRCSKEATGAEASLVEALCVGEEAEPRAASAIAAAIGLPHS